MSRTHLLDTLRRIEAVDLSAAPRVATKTAAPAPTTGYGALLRKLAGALREAHEPEITDEDLYDVLKTASGDWLIPKPGSVPDLHLTDEQLATMHPATAGRLLQSPVNFSPDVYRKLTALHQSVAPKTAEQPAHPGDPLRKLAHALRVAEAAQALARREKAAHTLRAAEALTLLRDRTRAL